MLDDLVLRQIGQPQAVDNRCEPHRAVVHHDLPLDAHADLPAFALEFPDVESSIGRQPDIDAVVRREILGRFRPCALLEVCRRADDGHPHVRTDRDHVLCDLFAHAHACVVPLRNDVGQTVVDDDLDVDVGVIGQDALKGRLKDRNGWMLSGRNSNRARGLVPQRAERAQLQLDLLESRRQGVQEPLSRLRGRHASSAASQQPHAETRL